MSTLKVNNLQVGQDGTAANNYTLYQPASPDGTVRLGYGVAGSVTDILTLKNSNLGIGTDNPSAKLHVVGGGKLEGNYEITNRFEFQSGDGFLSYGLFSAYDDMEVYGNYYTKLGKVSGAPNTTWKDAIIIENSQNLTQDLITLNANTFIDGNVGIGTSSPTANFKLDINGDLTLGESGGSDNTYIDQKQDGSLNIINSGRQSSTGGIRINKTNSIGGDTTYFRDFEVYDGKNNLVLLVDGSSGNVGIGDTNPGDRLTVYKANVGNPTGITIRNTESSSTYSHARLRLESQNAAAYADIWADVANSALRLGYNSSSTVNINSSGRITAPERIYVGETYNISNVSGSIGGSGGGQDYIGLRHGTTFGLMLKTAGTNVGNVGIGETEPVDRLVVQETNATGDVAVRIKNDTLTDGTAANPTTASLYLNTSTSDFNTFYIQARRNDNDTHFGYANPRDANHVPTMVITNEGNVYIGKTSADRAPNGFAYSVGTNKDDGTLILTNARTSGGSAVEINRSNSDGNAISFYRAGTSEGTITVSTSGTTYNTTSDIRLKTDINPISDATDKLMNMNPVTHKWKEDPDGDTVHGFIAQEMQNIAPEAVHGEPDGEMMMGMDYGRITPIIVAALQNAIEKINTLEQRISELEN